MEPISSCLFSLSLICNPLSLLATDAALQVQASEGQLPEDSSQAPTEKSTKQSASLVLAKVQIFYDGVNDLYADFRQTYVNPIYGTRTVSRGRLELKKPGMMHWDYEAAGDPDFYADGSQLCVVEHDTRQVVSQDIRNNPSLTGAMKFLFGGEQLTKDFYVRMASKKLVRRFGIKGHLTIEMKPKKKNKNYKNLLLVVDEKTGRVDAFVVRNQDNSTSHFELTGISLNTNIADEQFTCKVPKGYVSA